MSIHHSGHRYWVFSVLILLTVVIPLAVGVRRVQAVSKWQPAYNYSFADPKVMVYDNVEYAYATNGGFSNIPWAFSTDSQHWESGFTDALPSLPNWAIPIYTWAPSVARNSYGQFVMWYSARDTSIGLQCLSRAVASSPVGPFVDSNGGPVLCQPSLGGSIDPEILTAPNGTNYLYWKNDGNAVGLATILWGATLNNDLTISGPPVPLLHSDQQWQGGVIEGPDMTYVNGNYYLFYGANAYQSANAGIGFANCSGPLGPCVDSPYNPILDSTDGVTGPQGPDVFTSPTGQLIAVFSAWPGVIGYAAGGYRAMYEASVSFGPAGQPVFSPYSVSTSKPIARIYGLDAIGTSIAISQTAYPAGRSAQAVVLARSDFFSDALAGGPLAATVHGPLLITPGGTQNPYLDPRVEAEIERVLPPGHTVYLLGGPLALSPSIDLTLQEIGYETQRVAGANEYGTAVAIAEQLGNPTTIFEATGLTYPDALAAVPAAITTHGAILLTNGTTQSPETALYLSDHPYDTRYAIGGPLAAYGADPTAIPVFGADLYGTCAVVDADFFRQPSTFGAATGTNFPDALSAGPLLGRENAPIVLVPSNGALPTPIRSYLQGIAGSISSGIVFGGPLAVQPDVVTDLSLAIS